jgi:MFS family permease
MASSELGARLDAFARERRFAAGIGVSVIGDGIRFGAVPLLALRANAQPSEISLLFAVGTLPWLLFTLLAGAIVDRVDRRRLLIGLDLVRALLIAGVAVAAIGGAPPLVVLGAALFAMGTCEVCYTSGLVASLPMVVASDDRLATANAKLAAAQDVGQDLIGPAVGGVLFGIAAPLPFALDAVSFVVCAALVLSVRFRRLGTAESVPPRVGLLADVRSGLRWLRGRAELLELAIVGGLGNMANLAALSVTSWLVIRELGGSDAVYGLVLTVEALAGLAIAPVIPRATRGIGELGVIAASFALEGAGYVIAAMAPSIPVAFIGFACVGASAMGWNVVAPTVRQRHVPSELRGRVDSVYRLLMYGASPFGAVLAAALASSFGVRGALAICAACLALACAYVVVRLVPRFPAGARAEALT